jgi:type II secretory ATPase GspE/PulE/Tfp pilus assembly ATPase PilB-like protein
MEPSPSSSPSRDVLDLAAEGVRPIARLLNLILSEAFLSRSSEIQMQSSSGLCVIRFLREGTWNDVMTMPGPGGQLLVNRVRALAGADRTGGQPTHHGELHVLSQGTEVTLKVTVHEPGSGSEEVVILVPNP